MSQKTRVFEAYYFLFYMALANMVTLLPIHLANLGLDEGSIGLTMGAGLIASIVGPPVWGYLTDYLESRTKVLLFCQLGAILTSFVLSWAYWVASLALIYFVYNFFQTAIGPLADSLVLSSTGPDNYGRIRLWGSAGFAVGALLCGRALGLTASFRVFWLYILLASSALAIAAFLPKAKQIPVAQKITLQQVKTLVVQPQFRILILIVLLVLVPYGAYTSFLGLYLKALGASPFQIGLAWTIAALAEVPAFFLGYRFVNSQRAWHYLAIGALIFGVRWLIYGYVGNKYLVLLLQLSQSASFGIFFLVAVQLVNRLTPHKLKAVGQTIFASTSFGLSFAIGNSAGGYYAKYFGLGALFKAAGVLALLGCLLALWAAGRWTGEKDNNLLEAN